jgi:hypothetical protein
MPNTPWTIMPPPLQHSFIPFTADTGIETADESKTVDTSNSTVLVGTIWTIET